MNFKDVIAALRGAKSSLEGANSRLTQLGEQEAEIHARAPHTDDLVEWARLGLQTVEPEFEKRLSWYWNETNLVKWQHYEKHSPQLLAIGPFQPSQGSETLVTTGIAENVCAYNMPPPSTLCVSYFLRPLIEKELPRLVRMCFPNADSGLRSAERQKMLAKIRDERAQLEGQRNELLRQLEEARV